MNRLVANSYYLMQAALARYGRRYAELSTNERQFVQIDAMKAQRLEALLLASPQAAPIVIGVEASERALAEVKARYDSETAFHEDLRANHLREADLRAALERELWVEALMERIASTAKPVSDAEVRAWFEHHPDKFARAETRVARHILITINEDISENHRATALRRLQQLRAEMDGSLAQFEELARHHSECPTALEGGLIGRVPQGKLYAALDAALFALDEGEISGVIESDIGFHLVLCEKIHPAEIIAFAEAAPQIRAALTGHRGKEATSAFVAALLHAAGKR